MGWIVQSDNTLLHEETGVVYGPDSPVYFNIYEDEGKAYVFVTNEEIPDGVDPRDFVGTGLKTSKPYFDGDPMRNTIWKDKYKRKGINTPEKMFNTIADEFHRIECKYPNPVDRDKIFSLLDDFKHVLPGGSMLYGIGGKENVSLSNCFVIDDPVDSYGGICHTDQEMVQLMKRRGGVGFGLSKIRRNGSPVKNAAVTSTGVVPFMERYSNSTKEVAQGGRRGALMLTIPLSHPDAESFIEAKLDKKKINAANISVQTTDSEMLEFSNSLDAKKAKNTTASFISPISYVSSSGASVGRQEKTVKETIELLNRIAELQRISAEPGILFWDRIIRESPADCYEEDGFKTTSTNPCGELPLSPYDSCRLLHMNLFSYVDKPFTSDAEFDFEKLAEDVIIAQRLLDDAIDIELENIARIMDKIKSDPEPDYIKNVEIDLWKKIATNAEKGRRTGLGHTGIADVFAGMGMLYGSDEAIKLMETIQKEIAYNSYKSSIIMAKERGSFPIFNHMKEMDHLFIERIFEILEDEKEIIEMYHKFGRRNISNLTVAPTGTVSLLAGVSSGIEPVFDICYNRAVRKNNAKQDEWEEYLVVHPGFKKWYDTVLKKRTGVEIDKMSIEQVVALIPDSPYAGSLANNVDPERKIKLVGTAQRYVDHAISVTHNLPKGTTTETIKKMIALAFKSGCKGFTVYVDGSRKGVLNHIDSDGDKSTGFSMKDAVKRPAILDAEVFITTIASVVYCVAVGMLDSKPYEVFAVNVPDSSTIELLKNNKNNFFIERVRSGRYDLKIYNDKKKHIFTMSGFNKQMDADGEVICRIISTALRHGVDMTFLYEQINAANTGVNNFARALSRVLKKYVNSDKIARKSVDCPNCREGHLIFEEGCVKCSRCGYSKCN